MAQYNRWFQHIADAADLQGEALPGVPLVEVAGDSRVLIECHKGVCEYSTSNICIKVKYGLLCVCGSNLELIVMTKERLVIAGQIDSIQLIRRGK